MNLDKIINVTDKYGREFVKIERKDGVVLWTKYSSDDDYLIVDFKTSSYNEEVSLIYSRPGQDDIYDSFAKTIEEVIVDGESIDIQPLYTFHSPGSHTVKYKFVNNTLPDAYPSTSYSMFYMNNNVTGAEFGANLKNVGKYMFYYCRNLQSVFVGNNVEIISSYAFYGCSSLYDVNLGEKCSFLSSYAFYGCTALKVIEMMYQGVVETNTNALTGVSAEIYVPEDFVDEYKASEWWNERSEHIHAI